jgi:hypothetical protein
MKTSISYEWTLEEVDENGDIIDSNFAYRLSNFNKASLEGKDLGLVRNEGSEENGLKGRYWAYVRDGKLPETFEDGAGNKISIKVPKKFHTELNKYLITI